MKIRYAKQPDLKAPRFRYDSVNTLDDVFISHIKETNTIAKKLSGSQIRNIVKTFNETIAETVINHREGVDLPNMMGRLFIGSCKKTSSNIDFKTTLEHGGRILQHRNYESDNYIAKIFYIISHMSYGFLHHEIYGFKGCRNFTRATSKAFKIDWKKYIEVDPTMKLKSIYNKAKIDGYRKKQTEELLKIYNEFEF